MIIVEKGLEQSLLERAEAGLKDNGIEEMQLAGDPFHYFSGIPDQYQAVQKWAEKNGYGKRIDTYDLINHLDKKYAFRDDSVTFSILKKGGKSRLDFIFRKMFSRKMGL